MGLDCVSKEAEQEPGAAPGSGVPLQALPYFLPGSCLGVPSVKDCDGELCGELNPFRPKLVLVNVYPSV